MSFAKKIDPVIDRLGQVLDGGQLPHPYDRWGARLLDHLTKPVQVVVTGFEGTGKSALIEMMSGRPALGHDVTAPMIELAYGETEQVIITREDGSVSTVAGILKNCTCPSDARRIRQELPDERLSSNEFIEIGLTGDLAEKRAALNAVVDRADVIVWCSQDFGEEEQALWSSVPDNMKDHSLLVLTMADQQLMRGMLGDIIDRLDPIVAEEFLGLYPVATIQGITAQTCSDRVNEDLWASSGGKQLMELLSRQVRQGRNADYDQARIFMDRLAMRMPHTAHTTTEIQEEKQEITPPSTATLVALPSSTAESDFDTVEFECNAEAFEMLTEAVDLLQQHSMRMLREMDEHEDVDTDLLLSDCSEAMQSVSELLQSASQGDPLQQAVQDDIQDGEEMLMLFQLERSEDAALDAVTLMLQLRKELSQKLAG
ncbi:hypothetical protein EI983_02595 [Roseovarius faecimaris]|uniref:G domain-containing protein n=1 Tax=Roseovarius faecimaris TaxID=2494550 RepID=A0A6I6IN39_9RHOB|nr:hypothetical protein [Roseovarius faecimaris]QGX97223.1 hypothetical protein EI983_02595 [Roseovarius faecimaris]